MKSKLIYIYLPDYDNIFQNTSKGVDINVEQFSSDGHEGIYEAFQLPANSKVTVEDIQESTASFLVSMEEDVIEIKAEIGQQNTEDNEAGEQYILCRCVHYLKSQVFSGRSFISLLKRSLSGGV